MKTGVIDHIAGPGESAFDRACTLAREIQECGKSGRAGFLDIVFI